MKKIKLLGIILLAVFLNNCAALKNYGAKDSGIRVGPYVVTYARFFQSSDHGYTAQFNVYPDKGSEIPCLSEAGAYMPVYVALRVNGMLKSASINRFFSNEERCVSPYMLYMFAEEEYMQISGKVLEVTFITPERPYHGQNWSGTGEVFFFSSP